jgi:hypothetical protein
MKALSFSALTLALLFSSTVLADIAPTQFKAAGVASLQAAGVRMVSAKVDIVWGLPCTLTAVFVMENETKQPVEVDLGFPLNLPKQFREKDSLGFIMAFNGVPVSPSAITEVGKPENNYPPQATWYRCKHVFPSGQTKVGIKTKLPASLNYSPYSESLEYCLETGGAWAGNIGAEEVSVTFPAPLEPGQIIEARPAGFTVQGPTVCWVFKDFEPKGKEYDVHLQYLRPDVSAIIAKLRKELAQNPDNPKCTLKLAKHLFVLGPTKGYSHYPPSELTKAEFEKLNSRIKEKADRRLVLSQYPEAPDGRHLEKSSEWTRERKAAVRILSETDYEPIYWKSNHIDAARKLMEGVLKDHPGHAEAWKIYLANFYRFRFGGDRYYQPLIQKIKTAYQKCPQDRCIQLWYQRSQLGLEEENVAWETSDQMEKQLYDELRKQGIFEVEYKEVDYGYW